MSTTDAHHGATPPGWELDESGDRRRIVLSGSWRLFTASDCRRRMSAELGALDSPADMIWDLNAVEALDSVGAWVLWQVWNRQLPADLACRDPHRQRFDRLADAPDVLPPKSHRISPVGALDTLGAGIIGIAQHTIGLLALLLGVLMDIATCAVRWRLIPVREITASIYHTGVSSVLLLGVTGYVIGIVMSLQIGVTLEDFGANQRIIGLMGLAVMRELGPVIAAIIQAGRAGSSITAGIAGMHLTEELDALQTFGSSPRMRLVTSRVVAMMITMPLLVVWTDGAEILGGATTAQFDLNVPFALFIARLPSSVDIYNFWLGLGKGALFGLIIALVGSYFGLTARANTDSLSSQTTRSVVVGLSLILILDALSGAILAKMGLI
ncbi:ABC transporter permease [Salinisphaera sp.]|uniref:MlaE family ABC transporter permease n=1 Tax=Salinisphaera sp. TaxID=1914330 RepID=UPI002D764AA4|nr:ABC transporter permease [Salinisphaera sp.]HET7313138.1 ABC transporter permease [Salinisphaera sp.]